MIIWPVEMSGGGRDGGERGIFWGYLEAGGLGSSVIGQLAKIYEGDKVGHAPHCWHGAKFQRPKTTPIPKFSLVVYINIFIYIYIYIYTFIYIYIYI